MTPRLTCARNLYLRGINDGDPSVVADYTGDVYIQHSAGVADGVDGFMAFFEEFLERNPVRHIELVRMLEDENGVFVHAHQVLNEGETQWVTMDWFRFDEADKIVEHWDVIVPFHASNPSGRSSVDGPTEVVDRGDGAANAEIVTTALENLLMPGGDRQAGLARIAEEYIQHNAEVADGRDSFRDLVLAEDSPLAYQKIHRVCAQGNFVAVLSEATFEGKPYAQGDLFRLENGLIQEHWDAAEQISPQEEWANSGKF